MINITLIIFIIVYSSCQYDVNAQASGAPPPSPSPPGPNVTGPPPSPGGPNVTGPPPSPGGPNVTGPPPPSSGPGASPPPPPSNSSNPPPPGSCPDQFCPPGSKCRVFPCPPGMQYCCVCPPGRIGDKCNMTRQAIAQVTMKGNDTFNSSCTDSSSTYYLYLENLYCTSGKTIMANGFKQSRNQSVTVGCKCAKMESGSVKATMSMDLAMSDGSSTPITTLSETEMKAAIAATCTGTTCGNLDTSYLAVAASVDICASNTTHNCSQYATCTATGGLNYTCTCKSGYRDDGSGFTCTRLCSTNTCGSGRCTEQSGGDVLCTCPAGTSAPYCSGSYRVQQSLLILLISFLILPISLMNSSTQ